MKRTAKRTRHSKLAEQLSAMMAYRNRPEGEAEPLQTNWSVVVANDNNPEDVAEMSHLRFLRTTPSIDRIVQEVAKGETVRNASGQIVSIGALHFSDGSQTERAYCLGPEGKLIQFDAIMPVGSMLGTRDKMDGQLGGGVDPREVKASNDYFAEVLSTPPHRYRTGGKRRPGKSYTADESREMLRKAIVNTPKWPKLTRFPPGLPCGSASVADSFSGMRKIISKGGGGAISWEDIATARVNREIWAETLDTLKQEDKAALDYAATAANMRTLGETHGFVGKRAERMGKRILLAANDNLRDAMRKSAA